jgi:polyisoprenyl-phosphate glycosyltransferase
MNPDKFFLSICVPLYNEEDNIAVFSDRLFKILDSIPDGAHEIIFVDDGSFDRTEEELQKLLLKDIKHSVICIHFSRNFGHQLAISAALEMSKGSACIVMDGDLQDVPEAIPKLLNTYNSGYDVVYAKRIGRKENFFLKFAYSFFYKLISTISDLPLPIDSGDFSIISRRVVKIINSCQERNRYVRGLRAWSGFRQIGIEVERGSRRHGRSKYNLAKLIGLALDGICSFSIIPLRIAVFCGAIGVFLSMLYLLYAIIAWFVFDTSPPGFTTIVLLLSFLSSLQLLSMGVLGEYIGKIYSEVKMRPPYVVEKVEKNRSSLNG